MTRLGRLAVTAALVAAVTAGAAVTLALPQAAAEASCDGVWVVVDAHRVGGPVTTRCAPGSPDSGLAALRDVGHEVTLVARQPFVCRIDGRPAQAHCERFPPADAYWSYWHAEPGGSWRYSNQGPGTRTPPEGSVEGWAFGAGEEPSVPPPAPPPEPEPDPSPQPTPSPSPSPSTDPGSGGSTGQTGGSDDGTTSTPAPTDPPGTGDDPPVTESPTIEASQPTPTTPSVDAAAPQATPDPSSVAAVRVGGLQTLVGVLLIGAVVAGAFVVRARRQSSSPG